MERCRVCATTSKHFLYDLPSRVKHKKGKLMINSQKIWAVGLSLLLLKDLLYSSLTVFCQAVFAFRSAKPPQILDSHTCSTLNLIRETAQGKKFPGLWLILSPMTSLLLWLNTKLSAAQKGFVVNSIQTILQYFTTVYSVRPHFQMRRQKHLLKHTNSLLH